MWIWIKGLSGKDEYALCIPDKHVGTIWHKVWIVRFWLGLVKNCNVTEVETTEVE